MAALDLRKVLLVKNEYAPSPVPDALSGLDLSVVTAEGAEDAFRLLRGISVDLVILDLELPHMTGRELVARLAKEIPILMLTATEDDHVEGIRAVMRSKAAIREACVLAFSRMQTPRFARPVSPVEKDLQDEAFDRAKDATKAFTSAVEEAIAGHHREGREVVVERDGKLVRIEPPPSRT